MARTSERDDYEITGINVTPLVDIMLVLLVIFMVTTTYIAKEAIEVELPRVATAQEAPAETLLLLVAKDGKTYLDGVPLGPDVLARRLSAAPGRREDMQAVIAADREASHGAVVDALDLLRAEGIVKFAIQVQAGAGARAATERRP
jgi:biopolymer transport protein ExbD